MFTIPNIPTINDTAVAIFHVSMEDVKHFHAILRHTASWMGDHFVVKPSAIGQPTWPTQPPIPQGSVNE